jgi:hypothetical protein
MSKHTFGPWEIDTNGHYPTIRKNFRADHHMTVCGPIHGYMYADDEAENQMANARLIAAAPDLLAALEKADRILLEANPHCSADYLFSQIQMAFGVIRPAIAKATGAA